MRNIFLLAAAALASFGMCSCASRPQPEAVPYERDLPKIRYAPPGSGGQPGGK